MSDDQPAEHPPSGGQPEAHRKKHRIPRWLLWLVGLVILAVVLYWGYGKWQFSRHHESTDDAQVSGHLVPVLTRVAGYADQIFVRDNEHVIEGELLVVIEDTELREMLAEAEAALVEAEAGAVGRAGAPGQAETQLTQAERQEAMLAAQIDAARANVVKADRDLARAEELAAQEIISRQDLDAARAAAAAAHANLRALEEQRLGAAAGVTGARAGIRAAQARIDAARAAVAQAELQLSYARITAPVAGIVAKRSVEKGQYLQAGQPLLAVVADTGIYLTANFKETQLASIVPGQSVAFSVDAYGDCNPEGVVASLAGATGSEFALLPPENATGNFVKVVQRIPVRIEVSQGCGAARPLRPGMSVTVHVKTR